MNGFTPKQQGHARLAQALREMIPYAKDIHLGMADGTPMIWPAENIKEVLGGAADLIDTLTLEAAGKWRP